MLAGGAPCGGPLKAVCSTQQTSHPSMFKGTDSIVGQAACRSLLQAASCPLLSAAADWSAHKSCLPSDHTMLQAAAR